MPANNLPHIPQFDSLPGLSFITRAVVLGCTPNLTLAVEFAREPTGELLALLFLPDLFDIGQAIFEPRRGRTSRPNRHGRKGRGRRGLPDTSDMIGRILRQGLNPYDAIRMSPVKYVFRFLNPYEGVMLAVAIINKVDDIAFSAFYGPLMIRPNDCADFARFQTTWKPERTVSGPFGIGSPVNMGAIDMNVGYAITGFNVASVPEKTEVNWGVFARANAPGFEPEVSLRLVGSSNQIFSQSDPVRLSAGSSEFLAVSGFIPEGEPIIFTVKTDGGAAIFSNDVRMGFSQFAWPWD